MSFPFVFYGIIVMISCVSAEDLSIPVMSMPQDIHQHRAADAASSHEKG
jgi:hypothetical protein